MKTRYFKGYKNFGISAKLNRNFRPKISAEIFRYFGRNFGFGRTLLFSDQNSDDRISIYVVDASDLVIKYFEILPP